MATRRTFLAPGQRYAAPHDPSWRTDRQLTVLHLDRAPSGAVAVAVRGPSGELLTIPAAEIEAAVAAGQLVPVAGTGRAASC
jgi:hypothetical protein